MKSPTKPWPARLRAAPLFTLSALLAACATAPEPPAKSLPQARSAAPTTAGAGVGPGGGNAPAVAPGSAASSPTAAGPAPRPVPGAPLPFAEVTRDAKRAAGYLPVWTRDDKTWLEIPAALLDQPMFFGSSVSGGIGVLPFVPGLTGREHVVVLRRVGNSVQLLAKNQLARAPAGTPLAMAVAESYSDSLLGAAPLAAAPHLQSKALLVDAQLLLGGDIAGSQSMLEASFRLPYALDRSNSSVDRVRSLPTGLSITLRQHFAVPRLPSAPVFAPGAPPPNLVALPNPPGTVPDARSLFLGQTLNFAPLPAQPMKTRQADERVGYFTSSFTNFGDDKQEGIRTHFIKRWRLEKKDPGAVLSDPKEPIRVVLDRNIPEKWRAPLREAALEWNKAFERAGFRNALAVEQQSADADWSTLDGTRLLAVRWFAQQGPGSTAVGPSQADPRTGEILRGAAIIDENRVRVFRARAGESVPRWADGVSAQPSAPAAFAQPYALPYATPVAQPFAPSSAACTHAEETMDEARFGYELLVERGLLEPDSPEADTYIAEALKNVTMHEIGHVLGLRHNFRASIAMTPAQLRDRSYTQANGLSASVMEYNAQNLPLAGEPVADYNMTVLGAYDFWAIEWGYREFAEASESSELQALAARSEREPALAYATDDDLANSDPLVNQRDMSNDPLAFAQRQVLLARELLQRTTSRALKPTEDLGLYRRAVNRVLSTLGTSMPFAAKYVGGIYTTRAKAGANQPLVVPVPAAQQRAALDLLVAELFSSAAFKFDPRVMSRLGVDQFERFGPNRQAGVDFSLPTAVLTLQRGALDALMADSLAGRLADAESKVTDARQLLNYAEVQERLSQAVWSELDGSTAGKGAKGNKGDSGEPSDIDSLRRNLQREHLRRLASGLVRPAPATAADVRAVHRQAALALQARLAAAVASKRGTSLVRAHLEDSLSTLNEALKASLVRQAI